MTETLLAFAELGRLVREMRTVSFKEGAAVTDPDILEELQHDLLEPETGKLERLFNVTLNDGVFEGNASQRIALGRSQTYEFEVNTETGQRRYRLTDADEVAKFAETDEGWEAIAEYVAEFAKGKGSKAGKKLNCKPGNTQCGGKCQDGNKNCWAGMSPEEKKKAQALAKKAKGSEEKGKGGNAGTGVDGTTRTLENGDIQPNGKLGTVKNQEEFNTKMEALITDISNQFDLEGTVPIFMLRRASNLDRATFDKYMGQMQQDGRLGMLEGSLIPLHKPIGRIPPASTKPNMTLNNPINAARWEDGWTTPLGKPRSWAKLPSAQ